MIARSITRSFFRRQDRSTYPGIEPIDYFQTEQYQVTRDFLVNPQRMLDRLLDPAPKAPGRKIRQPGGKSK